MTEVLITPQSGNGRPADGGNVIREDEYKTPFGETVPYTVVQDSEGVERMVEQTGEPTQAPKSELPDNWRELLTPSQRAIQADRDEWEKQFPGKSYLTPEGPTMGPEDLTRLDAEAIEYGFDLVPRADFVAAYEDIQAKARDRETALRQLFDQNYPDRKDQLEDVISKERAKVVEQQQLKKLAEMLPIPEDAGWRQRRKITKQRAKLQAILEKNPEEFTLINADWQAYEDVLQTDELADLQEVGLKDDKSLIAKQERRRVAAELDMLDDQNGEALDALAAYFVDGEGLVDESISKVLAGFKEQVAKHKTDKAKDDLLTGDKWLAFQDLKWRLGEIIASKHTNLSDEDVKAESDHLDEDIQDWLEAIASSDRDPVADLKEYRRLTRAYEIWDNHRHRAVEFLAPVVMMHAVERKFVGLAEKAGLKEASPEEALKTVLDPSNIGERNGGWALRDSGELGDRDARVFAAGIRGQLSQAMLLSRHEGTMMKAALLLSGFARGGAEDLLAAWDRLPLEEKRKQFRKKIYGKAAVGSVMARRMALNIAKKIEAEAKYQAGYLYITEKEGSNGR